MEIVLSEWDHCPTEILCLIFEKLETYGLLTCMQVNTRWRKIARYIAQARGKWKSIIEDIIEDKGVSYIDKSKLDWCDVYTNTFLWRYICEANVILGRVYQESIVYQATRIKSARSWFQEVEDRSIVKDISVYKDNLIVNDRSELNYYGITEKRSNLRKTEASCITICENDHMLVIEKKIRSQVRVCMYGKRSADDDQTLKNTVVSENAIVMYKLFGNRCYLVKHFWDIAISVYIWNSKKYAFTEITLGSYIGSIDGMADMHVCKDQNGDDALYIMLKCGKILRCHTNDFGPLEIVFQLKVPPHAVRSFVYNFHKHNAVLSSEEFKVTLHGKQDAMVIECPKLKCIASHGNVLILGRVDGKVDIYLKKKLKMKNYKPERQIDLLDFKKNIKHREILKIDIHESKRIHYLFIRTVDSVYQFNISHPKLINAFEDED